ncbi:hypothetical protein VP01_4282g1 [Puccinia sorghi]|uniref:Integrase catalytic domain-containing protein n=1 Tax=Puccinia sorghi TaxID=27349 RepID=A0A0L6US64_9BASI|nr:hypothetical protein VP01_4282g1 [Puccinia sorghi]
MEDLFFHFLNHSPLHFHSQFRLSKPNSLAIEGKGSITFSYNGAPYILHDVPLVPEITANFLSLRQLLLNETLFEGNYCHDLPVIPYTPFQHESHLSIADKLHKSLGHVSYSRIRNKLGIPIKPDGICESCAVSKSTKALYKHRSSSAYKPFEEIHLDLIGPITPMSYQKHKYILTIVDSNTRFCAAIPLTTKAETSSSLKYAIDVEAKRFGYYPSILHSDWGGEFVNEGMEEFCRKKAMKQRFSDAYTPQQNGLAERFNQTP